MKQNIWLCIVAIVLAACGGGDGPGDDTISKDFIKVTPNRELQLDDDGNGELSISANCSWEIIVPASENWLTVSPLSGNKNQKVTVRASKNLTGVNRHVDITIQGGTAPTQRVTIKQAMAYIERSLSVDPNALNFEAKSESKSFTINSNTNWNITKPEWCTLSETSGSGNSTITVTASENTNQEIRSGQIVITGYNVADATIAVSQKAKESNDNQEPGKDDNQPPS